MYVHIVSSDFLIDGFNGNNNIIADLSYNNVITIIRIRSGWAANFPIREWFSFGV